MIGLQTIAVAFAMFSALPVPQFAWNQKNMRYAMCAFPLIGVVIGGLWCLCGALPLPMPAKAAGFCLIPVWVTGGIHLDGYADTCDALSSYGDREKKLEILKDPHCGAFAVIRLCSYFAAYLALCACVDFTPRVGLCWTLALVLERALSGLGIVPDGKEHRPCPHLCHGGGSNYCPPGADGAGRSAQRRPAGTGRLGAGAGGIAGVCTLSCCFGQAVWRHHRRSGRVVFAESRAVDAGGAVCLPVGRTVMIFITGPLYSGKRTFAQRLPGTRIAEVQALAAEAEDLEKLAEELSAYDIVMATEVGGGVVPMDAGERAAREAAGRLACLLAARADCVVQMFCGIPTVLKGELPPC